MKHLASTFWLSALVLLNGCGGGREDGGNGGGGTPPTSSLNVSGNWQLSTISTVPGMPALEIAGSITQSGNSLNGAVHVDGSDCLDQVTTLHLAGALTGSNATLTSDPVGQQVITLTGSVTKGVLTGTYAIDGGCANGDQGNVSGFRVTPFSGTWRSLFSINDEHYPGITTVTQDSASSEGSFGITGENDDSSNLSCLSGMIKPGTFPSPSFIMGKSLALEIQTSDGTIVFLGSLDPTTSEIGGTFTISGGTCDKTFGFACFVQSLQKTCKVP